MMYSVLMMAMGMLLCIFILCAGKPIYQKYPKRVVSDVLIGLFWLGVFAVLIGYIISIKKDPNWNFLKLFLS